MRINRQTHFQGPIDVYSERWRIVKVARVVLAALDTPAGIAAWQNPEGFRIIIHRVMVDIQTAAAGATVAIGTAASPISANNLIDAGSLASTGLIDNIDNKGAAGKSRGLVVADSYVTATTAGGSAAGLTGEMHIEYTISDPNYIPQ